MNRKHSRILAIAVVVGVISAAFTPRASASAATYTFTMLLRLVHGEKNKTVHALDAGDLTFNGSISVIGKLSRATSDPEPVTIAVMKSSLLNSEVCSVSVTPERIFNKLTRFSTSCGHVDTGIYFLIVSKGEAIDKTGDGWHIQGSGALTTK